MKPKSRKLKAKWMLQPNPDLFGLWTIGPACMQSFFKSIKCLCHQCRPDLIRTPERDLINAASDDLAKQIDRQIINSFLNP